MPEMSVREHRSERIGRQQALEITVDRLGRRCLQVGLVFCAEGLELEHEQAAQRGDAPFLAAFLVEYSAVVMATSSLRGSNSQSLARTFFMFIGSITWNM